MAVTETIIKNAVSMKLNNGQDASGNTRTVSVGLGSLSDSNWDAQKAMNIVGALIPCLSRTLTEVQHVATNRLSD